MSGQQEFAFENWEEAAEGEVQQEQKVQVTTEQVQKNDQQNQQQKQKDHQKVQKQAHMTLKQKVQYYKKLTPENFSTKVQGSQSQTGKKTIKLGGTKVFKELQDFTNFAKQIAEKLCEGMHESETLDEQSINTFIQEFLLYIYDGMKFQNYFQILKKIKVLKNQRKKIQKTKPKKAPKQKQKKQDKYDNKPVQNDDLFGGAAQISSKQEQQQRKKKADEKKKKQDKKIEDKKQQDKKQEKKQQKQQDKKQAPPTANNDDDDDDFM